MTDSQLSFFPTPYPNEDFRSVIYRYHYYENGMVFSETIQQLFGLTTLKIRHLPRNMAYLKSMMPRGVNIKDILLNTTMLKLFESFSTKEQQVQILDDVLYGNKGRSSLAGVLSGSSKKGIISDNFNYCLKCINEDYQTYGECYVHKYHQIQHLNICYKHNSQLISRCPTCHEFLARSVGDDLLCKPLCPNGHLLVYMESNSIDSLVQLKYELVRDFIFLTENGLNMDAVEMSHRIITCFGARGFINSSGMINKSQILREMFNHYSETVLEEFNQRKKFLFERRTLKRILKPEHMNSQIFFYILLMKFLAGTVEKFFESKFIFADKLPFGTGPWNCQNSKCSKQLIRTYKMTIKSQFFIGKFKCNECGCTYLRKKHFKANVEDETLTIRTIGFQKREQIQKFYTQGWSKKNIARHLNISDRTVGKYCLPDSMLKSKPPSSVWINEIQSGIEEVCAGLENSKCLRYREVLQPLLQEGQNFSRMEIKKLKRVQYNWLSKNDKTWFDKNIPPVCVGGSEKLNYDLIDHDLSNKIRTNSSQLYRENPQRQIKPYTILSRLSKKDFGRYSIYKDVLPKTKRAVNECSEEKIDYLIRILPQVVSYLRGINCKDITFQRLGFRRGYKSCTEKERVKVEQALNQYLIRSENSVE
jgi:hypothetical protein